MFLLLTDNTGVKHLFTHLGVNPRQARWMEFLSEFEFEVKHMKPKENKVVDGLSRRTHEIYEITVSQPKGNSLSRIKIDNINGVEYGNLLNRLLTEFNID